MSSLLYTGIATYLIGFAFTLPILLADEKGFTEPRWNLVFGGALLWPIPLMWILIHNILWKHI